MEFPTPSNSSKLISSSAPK